MAALATPAPDSAAVTDARAEKKAAQKARRKASNALKRAEVGMRQGGLYSLQKPCGFVGIDSDVSSWTSSLLPAKTQ